MKQIMRGCLIGGFVMVILIVAAVISIVRSSKTTQNKRQTPSSPASQPVSSEEFSLPPGTVLKEGIAIVVLVDTSGSMNDPVVEPGKKNEPKIEIAKRVSAKTLKEIEEFAGKNPDKVVMVGVSRFSSGVSTLAVIGPPGRPEIYGAIDSLTASDGTAIGEAIIEGKKSLNAAGYKKNFIIVVTDGENTEGRLPADVMKTIRSLPAEQQPGMYLVAFDIEASRFKDLQDQGVLIMEAQNEVHLQHALDYILYEKILVEQPM